MKRLHVVCAAVAAMVAVASAAEAQVQVGIGAGPSFPIGDYADHASTGFNVQGGVRVGIPLFPVAARADALYNQWAGEDGNDNVLGGALAAELALPGVVFTPYFLAGAGVYRVSIAHGDHRDEETKAGFNAGLGARFGLGGLGVFAEARLHATSVDGESVQFIPVTFGVRF
jgi:hypothetical protein